MKACICLSLLCLVGCASLPKVGEVNSGIVAAQAVTAAVCAEPVPHEMVEPCKVLAESLVKAHDAAQALQDAGAK